MQVLRLRKPRSQHLRPCRYPRHQQSRISNHPSQRPTTPIRDITNCHRAIGRPTIQITITLSSRTSRLPKRLKKKPKGEMGGWVDIGKNSIPKGRTLLISMWVKVWRRPGRRRRGGRRWSSRDCQAMTSNTRSVVSEQDAGRHRGRLWCSLLVGDRADQGSGDGASSALVFAQHSFHSEGRGQSIFFCLAK